MVRVIRNHITQLENLDIGQNKTVTVPVDLLADVLEALYRLERLESIGHYDVIKGDLK